LRFFGVKFLGQRRDVRLDNLMARGQLLLASLDAPASHCFQIIYIKQRNVIESGDSRIDVTRHGQIDEKQRAIAPCLQQIFNVFATQYRLSAARRSDDNVDIAHFKKAITEADRFSAAAGREIERAVKRTIRNEDRLRAFFY
jgi:hypothetical protein